MNIKIGQFFTRGIYGCKEPNTYMVCGIIRTDKPIDIEHTHIITADNVIIHESMDVSNISKGNNLDGIMTSPIWKIKIW